MQFSITSDDYTLIDPVCIACKLYTFNSDSKLCKGQLKGLYVNLRNRTCIGSCLVNAVDEN